MEGLLQFEHKYMLWVLISIPVVIALYYFAMHSRKRRLKAFGDEQLVRSLMPESSVSAYRWKIVLFLIGWTLVIIGASGPRIGSKLREIDMKGREIIIALDVSNSMLTEDIRPSRLGRAKQLISRMVDNMDDDKIGLIVFAGDAYTQIPITDDYPSVKMFLSSTGPEMISRQGTAIGAAIDLAMKSFPTEKNIDELQSISNRAIVIITDGENHEDDAIMAAEAASEAGIKLYTVGLGTSAGEPIPVSPGSKNMRRDASGTPVVSKLNEELLIEIAGIGKGAYVSSSNINDLVDELNKLDKTNLKKKIYTEFEERYQYFLGFGLLLLIIEAIIVLRKNPLIAKLNLFNT